MQLVSTITKTIPTIKGDKTAKIYAELEHPFPNSLAKEISFGVHYYFKETYVALPKKEAVIVQDEEGNDIEIDAGREEVVKERKITLFRDKETYKEEQVEVLYAQIKSLLPPATTFFGWINEAIAIGFEQKIKQGNYFELQAHQWEKVAV